MPNEDGHPLPDKDTVRAKIILGFHKFEKLEDALKVTLLFQCDMKVLHH